MFTNGLHGLSLSLGGFALGILISPSANFNLLLPFLLIGLSTVFIGYLLLLVILLADIDKIHDPISAFLNENTSTGQNKHLSKVSESKVSLSEGKCSVCGKIVHQPFFCKGCSSHFCAKHILNGFHPCQVPSKDIPSKEHPTPI